MPKEIIHRASDSQRQNVQSYPKILNKIGDKIKLVIREHGEVRTLKAEVMAIYPKYVLVLIDGKYRTTIHCMELARFKGGKTEQYAMLEP